MNNLKQSVAEMKINIESSICETCFSLKNISRMVVLQMRNGKV